MIQPNMALRLVAATLLVGAIAWGGGAVAASGDMPMPGSETKVVAAEASLQKEVPTCARKVKVVYAGYGEADRAACTSAAKLAD